MSKGPYIWTGGVGTAVAAICCFMPVLVVLLGSIGLSAWVGWIDYVIFPALAVFAGVLGHGLFLRRRERISSQCRTTTEKSSESM